MKYIDYQSHTFLPLYNTFIINNLLEG